MASGRIDVLIRGSNPAAAVPQPARIDIRASIPTPVMATQRFAGDPGAGNFYLGVAPNVSSIATHETQMAAPLAMIRTYSTSGSPGWSDIDAIIAGGRIPWMSWLEGSRTMANIASGAEDAWIDTIAAGFAARAPWPIFWTFHHEPENDVAAGGNPTFKGPPNLTNAASFRAAQRRIKLRLRAAGVTNDVFCAVNYQTPSTFNTAASNRDWRIFYPDWKNVTGLGTADAPDHNDFWINGDSNSVVDCIGLDFYHNWDLGTAMTKWTTVTAANVWNVRLQPKIEFLGKALAIGEWATAAAQDNLTVDPNGDGHYTLAEYNAQAPNYFPATTASWIDDYFTTLKSHGCVAFCYWDSSLVAPTDVANNPLSVCDPAKTRWQQLGVWGRSSSAKQWSG